MKELQRKTYPRFFTALLIGSCYLWLILRPQDAGNAARETLALCAKVVIPSLFPFFVCGNLLCSLRLLEPLERKLQPVMQPLFHLPGVSAAAIVLGLTGGYPSGAQAVSALYASGSICKPDAKRLLCFCNNCGPAFIFGVAGSAVFGSLQAGLLLYLVHCICAFLCGLLQPKSDCPAARTPNFAAQASAQISDSEAFIQSVKAAGSTILEVCMFVVVFGVVSSMLQSILSSVLPATALVFITGLLELSGGMHALSNLALPQGLKFMAASFFLAFGGLSVHTQTKAVLAQAGLQDLPVFLPKLKHALLSACMSLPAYLLFQEKLRAAQTFAPAFQAGSCWLFGLLASGLIFFVFQKIAGSILAQHRV